ELPANADRRLPLSAIGRYPLERAGTLCRARRSEHAAIEHLEVGPSAVPRVAVEEANDPCVADVQDLAMQTADLAFLIPEAHVAIVHEQLGLPETPKILIVESDGRAVAQAKVTGN